MIKLGLHRILGDRLIGLYHSTQIFISKWKIQSLGDSHQVLLSYLEHNDKKPFHVIPPWLRQHFFSAFPVWIIQDYYEFMSLLGILDGLKPETILEIGSGQGGSILMFTRVLSPEGLIIGVDNDYASWRIALYKSFATGDQSVRLVKGDSHDLRTLRQVEKMLDHRRVDMLFIDADHTYEGVSKDFEIYSPLVRRGGIVAFHDIVDDTCEVPQFWKQVKKLYAHREFVNIPRHWGIGILYMG